jgi:hypothetical protein
VLCPPVALFYAQSVQVTLASSWCTMGSAHGQTEYMPASLGSQPVHAGSGSHAPGAGLFDQLCW